MITYSVSWITPWGLADTNVVGHTDASALVNILASSYPGCKPRMCRLLLPTITTHLVAEAAAKPITVTV